MTKIVETILLHIAIQGIITQDDSRLSSLQESQSPPLSPLYPSGDNGKANTWKINVGLLRGQGLKRHLSFLATSLLARTQSEFPCNCKSYWKMSCSCNQLGKQHAGASRRQLQIGERLILVFLVSVCVCQEREREKPKSIIHSR